MDAAAGRPVEELAGLLRERAGLDGIRDTGVDRDRLATCAAAAARRPELGHIPPSPDEAELLALYEAAW
jgi:alcohol dehydrogenase class IV